MRLTRILAALGLCGFAGIATPEAGILEDRKNEWQFSISRTDREDVFENSQANFTWYRILASGYHQLGVTTSYFKTEVKGPSPSETDGNGIGPAYQFNFTPANDRATGFVFAQYETFGGDFGDMFDGGYSVGIGIKTFAGNSASVVVLYSFDEFLGADGFEDQDQTRLEVGISLFSGRN